MGVSTRDLNAFWKIAEIDTNGVSQVYFATNGFMEHNFSCPILRLVDTRLMVIRQITIFINCPWILNVILTDFIKHLHRFKTIE